MFAAKLYDDVREADRVDAGVDATVRDEARRPHDVTVVNLSRTGCGIETAAKLTAGAAIRIGLPGAGVHAARVVRAEGRFFGCEFDTPIGRDAVMTALTFDSVVTGPFDQIAYASETPRAVENKFSPRRRLAIIIGSAALLWVPIIAGVAIAFG